MVTVLLSMYLFIFVVQCSSAKWIQLNEHVLVEVEQLWILFKILFSCSISTLSFVCSVFTVHCSYGMSVLLLSSLESWKYYFDRFLNRQYPFDSAFSLSPWHQQCFKKSVVFFLWLTDWKCHYICFFFIISLVVVSFLSVSFSTQFILNRNIQFYIIIWPLHRMHRRIKPQKYGIVE